MLERLYIKNYSIIEEVIIDFGSNLNVLTGETGAGKSIIVGALSLVLGDRADTSVLSNKEEKCIVEATFQIKENSRAAHAILSKGLDFDKETTIRREITDKGKTRAFINDTPVNLTDLSEIMALLVDLHRQFDQYLLSGSNFEYEVLDAFAGNKENFAQYTETYKDYQKLSSQLDDLVRQNVEWQKEQDYKKFLFDELDTAKFQENELEEVEDLLKRLSHAEQIKSHLYSVYFKLEEGEHPLNNELRRLEQELQSIENVYPQATDLVKRIESARIELKDIASECDEQSQKTVLDPEQLQNLQERLDLGYRLMKKHSVQSTNELIHVYHQLSNQIQEQQQSEAMIAELQKNKERVFNNVKERAKIIQERRTESAPRFSDKVNVLLHLIGMPNAQVKVSTEPKNSCGTMGMDEVQFLWDANKSGVLKPVAKTASGGELSRIMLCIKALTAEAIDLPTLIFDEVDTGVSGEAAKQIGLLLQKLGQRHQIICITHLPQVAGKGNTHFFVYKVETEGKIKTHVRSLNYEERILSVARMIGGENPSEAVLENAREIVGKEL